MYWITHSENETKELARQLGSSLAKNSIVCLFGDLGAGKTTFMKGFAAAAAQFPEEQVSSPTFTYLNIYTRNLTVYHFDLYRLHDGDEFLSMGFDEYFYADGICCVEWSEKIQALLPDNCVHVVFTHLGRDMRKIEITPWSFP